ncbi:hypothetical protein [Pseudomonas sp. KCJK9000]|uniref:hypothetical protein n=1 Tax=Pseudomonas sp. KCJK9000 TaxID=3344566 RepID=UPI003905EB53
MTPAILLQPRRVEVLRGMADDAGDVLVPAGELHTLLAAHEDARSLAVSLPVLLARLERCDALLRALVSNGGAPEVLAGVETYLSQRFQEVPRG